MNTQRLRVLITAPSINARENVSGISTVVAGILAENSHHHDYYHFRTGRKDGEKKNIIWLWRQLMLTPRFLIFMLRHKIDLVHLNSDLMPASIVRDCPLLLIAMYVLRKPVILHYHGGKYMMEPPSPGSWLYRIIQTMLKGANTLLVLTETERKTLITHFGVSAQVMPNAVKENPKYITRRYNGPLRFLYLGRIVTHKGIDLIAEAFRQLQSRLDDLEFWVCGQGPQKEHFLKTLDGIPGLKYEYKGVVDGEKKAETMYAAEVFLLPSYFEGLPMAMLENMNHGCIPLGSDDQAFRAVLSPPLNGLMARKGSAEDLASHISWLLDNKDKLAAMSKSAYDTIQTKYSIKNYINQLNQIYTNALDHERSKLFRNRHEPSDLQRSLHEN